MYRFDAQELGVPEFPAEGHVLDIGGGGEGVIGRMKPKQVIAIDLSRRELEEAPEGPLKLVMDATDLKFLDRSFPTVTAFYMLMYVRAEADQQRVFREVPVRDPAARPRTSPPIASPSSCRMGR